MTIFLQPTFLSLWLQHYKHETQDGLIDTSFWKSVHLRTASQRKLDTLTETVIFKKPLVTYSETVRILHVNVLFFICRTNMSKTIKSNVQCTHHTSCMSLFYYTICVLATHCAPQLHWDPHPPNLPATGPHYLQLGSPHQSLSYECVRVAMVVGEGGVETNSGCRFCNIPSSQHPKGESHQSLSLEERERERERERDCVPAESMKCVVFLE